MGMRPRYIRIGDWASSGFNVFFLNGENDESTSGRSYYEGSLLGKPKWLMFQCFIDALFSWYESEHCRKSYEADLERLDQRCKEAVRA